MKQTRRRGGVHLAVCVMCGVVLVPAEGWAISVAEAVRLALTRQPEVQAAEAEVAQARADVSIARNGYLPSLNASTGPAGGGVEYDVTLSQTLYDFGQVRSSVAGKRAVLDQKRANLGVVRDNAALQVVEVYLDIADRRVELVALDAHLERLGELAEMARTRVEGRYADQAEVARVRVAVAGAEGERARLRGELTDAMDQFRLLVDAAPDGIQLPPLPGFLEPLAGGPGLEAAIMASPLYQRAALAVRAADADVRQAKAGRWPRLALEGSVDRREIGGRLIEDRAVALRLRLGVQGLAGFERPKLEEQRRRTAEMNAEGVARDLRRVVGSLRALDAALAGRIDAFADQSQESDRVRRVYREQFLVGRREIQDLVVMETEHVTAERQITELTIERFRLRYRAAAQLGLLAEALAPSAAEAEEAAR
ncbi:TolC family protein [Caulobacter endophyticus]|uniref:TolC family protein n=1 Tax=Caulobacter endophyticus TaxID=2172652 RepID=UPI0024101198|nr:TolC family protein [Caulobacter endophyticus]MDG2527223.1 TolC family protein [Caulobacter endophyticus]